MFYFKYYFQKGNNMKNEVYNFKKEMKITNYSYKKMKNTG